VRSDAGSLELRRPLTHDCAPLFAAARATRQRALDLAERAGREDLLLVLLTAWTEPTPWLTRPYGVIDDRAVHRLERLLGAPISIPRPATRVRVGEWAVAEDLYVAAPHR
jgi:hypothetical protein